MLTVVGAAAIVQPLSSQEVDDWGSDEALALAELGRRARAAAVVRQTPSEPYRARAIGSLLFLVDRPSMDERVPIRVDQLAVDIRWAPRLGTRQQIVGWRTETLLPTSVRYHLDHLTVLHDDLTDLMRLGNGDEVDHVLHPLAPGSGEVYDYGLGDSVSLALDRSGDTVRVRELLVRPKSAEGPGFVGSLNLDLETGAVARSRYTFTSGSYVDPTLDYVRASLEYGYWGEAGWLPSSQVVELRRESATFDFLGGTVIRTSFEVGPYEFGTDPPVDFWSLPPITALPQAVREAFPFSEGVPAQADEVGLAEPAALRHVGTRAAREAAMERLSSFQPLRVHVGRVSDVIRYNDAEGLYLGGGIALRPAPELTARLSAGYAFDRGAPSFAAEFVEHMTGSAITARMEWDGTRDAGQTPGIDPTLNSLGMALGFRDHFDHFLARGVSLHLGPRAGLRLGVRFENQRPARDAPPPGGSDEEDRARGRVREGAMVAAEGCWTVDLAPGYRLELSGSAGSFENDRFAAAIGKLGWSSGVRGGAPYLHASLKGGVASSLAPPQALHLIGGRGTIPGYSYRLFTADRYFIGSAGATLPILSPWFSLRLAAHLGATGLSPTHQTTSDAPPYGPAKPLGDSGGLLPSVGIGAAIGWNVLRIDLARALRSDEWELFLSVSPTLGSWL